jgi:hypothetical protein
MVVDFGVLAPRPADVATKVPLYPEALIPDTIMASDAARLFPSMVNVAVPEDQLAAVTLTVFS